MDTVLITGCSSGIGRASALAFAEADWRVVATAREENDIGALAAAGCETHSLDVTDGEAVSAVVAEAESGGGIDVLVNNAGYGQFGPLEDLSTTALHEQFDVNVYGPHRLCRAVLPRMRERGRGRVVNVSSNLGRVAIPLGAAYCGSKFALEAMSDALRAEVGPHGLHVVLIEPGPVATEFRDRVTAEATGLDRSGAYDTLYQLLSDSRSLTRDGLLTVSAERVAATVLQAATCANPAPRYRVGPIATVTEFARLLPDRWRDAALRLAVRLTTWSPGRDSAEEPDES